MIPLRAYFTISCMLPCEDDRGQWSQFTYSETLTSQFTRPVHGRINVSRCIRSRSHYPGRKFNEHINQPPILDLCLWENSFRKIASLNVFRPCENEKLPNVLKLPWFEECFRKFRFGNGLVWKIVLDSDGPLISLCGPLLLLSSWSAE